MNPNRVAILKNDHHVATNACMCIEIVATHIRLKSVKCVAACVDQHFFEHIYHIFGFDICDREMT